MNALSRWCARRLWWVMLWVMRRPGVRKLRHAEFSWISDEARVKFRTRVAKQDGFARRYGLRVLQIALTLMFLSMMFTVTYFTVLAMIESGLLSSPEK